MEIEIYSVSSPNLQKDTLQSEVRTAEQKNRYP